MHACGKLILHWPGFESEEKQEQANFLRVNKNQAIILDLGRACDNVSKQLPPIFN
jgi:hypothetical protein